MAAWEKVEKKMSELNVAEGRRIAADIIATDGDKEVTPRRLTRSELSKFTVEYALVDRDLVFHFFRPEAKEQEPIMSDAYWKITFPSVLDVVAQKHFNAGQDRLSAEFISDFNLDSWYLQARGYDHILDLEGYVEKFYRLLEEGLISKET